jgi:hypothetical protein
MSKNQDVSLQTSCIATSGFRNTNSYERGRNWSWTVYCLSPNVWERTDENHNTKSGRPITGTFWIRTAVTIASRDMRSTFPRRIVTWSHRRYFVRNFFLLERPNLFAICNNTFSKWWEGWRMSCRRVRVLSSTPLLVMGSETGGDSGE